MKTFPKIPTVNILFQFRASILRRRTAQTLAEAIMEPGFDFSGAFGPISGILGGEAPPKQTVIQTKRAQLERAPNAVTFIESPKFLDGITLNYPQFEVVRDFTELLCPFCNDIHRVVNVKDVPREDQVLFEHDHCPQCNYYKYEDPDILSFYNDLIGVVGMRAGKSILVGSLSAYFLHEYLCIPNLHDKLGISDATDLDISFVASTGDQSAETVYGYFRNFYDSSPWFTNYVQSLRALEREDLALHPGSLYIESTKRIHFKEHRIRIKSLTSNSNGLAGRTRLLSIIDELARLDVGESKRSGTEVYRVLRRALQTLRSRVARIREDNDFSLPDAKMLCVSSPMYDDDMSMTLLKRSDKHSKMFGFKSTTWEFNPDVRRDDLAEEYEADPVGADRDFGANPPGSENPFIESAVVDAAILPDSKNALVYREHYFDEVVNNIEFNYVEIQFGKFHFNNLNDYFIHCDPGEKKDSFCLGIGHREGDNCIIDGGFELRPIPKGNAAKLQPREAYFPAVVDFILELNRLASIYAITYDKWQSTDQIQRLRSHKILALGKNLNREDHVRFSAGLRNHTVFLPTPEIPMNSYTKPMRNVPCAKAIYELKHLNDNGVRVDHSKHGSNDMIQTYVGVHRLIMHPEEVLDIKTVQKARRGKQIANRYPKKLGRVVSFRR